MTYIKIFIIACFAFFFAKIEAQTPVTPSPTLSTYYLKGLQTGKDVYFPVSDFVLDGVSWELGGNAPGELGVFGTTDSNDISILSHNVERIRVTATGLIGLGITPTERLHVSGNVRFSGALMPNNTAGTSGQVLTSAGAGAPPTWTTPATGTVTGTGTANYVAYWSGASSQTASERFQVSNAANPSFKVSGTNTSATVSANMYSSTSTHTNSFRGVKGSGSIASPGDVASSTDDILNLTAAVYLGGSERTAGSINFKGAGVTNGSNRYSSEIQFLTSNGAAAQTQRMVISKDGIVGVGVASPAASSILDLTSTTQGFLSPRMTTTQRNAIASPATGLQVYNTSLNKLNFYNGSAWSAVLDSTTADARFAILGGNTGPITIGTNNTTPFHLETGGTRRLTIPSSGIANTPSSNKALVLSPDDSLGYTTLQSSDFTATVTQSGSDTLQNTATCYGFFHRTGNYVDLDVRIEVAFTSTGNANTFYFDPPIASDFTTDKTDVIGRGSLDTQALSSSNIPQQRCLAFASTADDKIGISVDPPDSLTYPDNRMYITVQLRYVIQ